jgi:hypothetical protein
LSYEISNFSAKSIVNLICLRVFLAFFNSVQIRF